MKHVPAALLLLACAGGLRADVILSGEALNAALKTLQRLRQQSETGAAKPRAEALFQVGVQGDALTTLLNDEVTAHGMQEKGLIDLALSRARESGVHIAWTAEKRKFFYDGAAFEQCLKLAPNGPRAALAGFWLLENEFYRSRAEDAASLLAATERKKAFLQRYPRFKAAGDVAVFLAIDYRDLYRHYQAQGDAAQRDRFKELARAQFRDVMRRFPNSEPAKIAEQMLRRFEAELRTREGG
jgi:TolA-binding protein